LISAITEIAGGGQARRSFPLKLTTFDPVSRDAGF
jgi:hypothetical protein